MKFFRFIPIVLLIIAQESWAEKRPMTLADMLNIPAVSSVQLSPDGKQFLYVLSVPDWERNRSVSHIWRINTDGNGGVQLTNGETGESSPRWAPGGRKIVFLARRGESKSRQIYVINNDGGEARPLSNHETSISSIEWQPDGEYLYFLASDPESAEEKEKKNHLDDVYAFEQDFHQRHLWKISMASGEESRITSGNFSVLSYSLSPDGNRIVFQRSASPVREDADHSEVCIMNSDGSAIRQLTQNNFSERSPQVSPDNQSVIFLADANEDFDYYYERNIFLISIKNGRRTLLLEDFQHEILDAHWSQDGKSIIFLANLGVHTELFQYVLENEDLEQLTDGQHALSSWHYSPELKTHACQLINSENPGDIWLLLKGQEKPRRITHIYDYLADNFYLPRQEVVHWTGADGVQVEGLLTYPLDYQPGMRCPLSVQTHGGPRSSDKFGYWRWRTYIPVMAAKGYAVLAPNYRGSTGYGDDFLRDMVGHYYSQSHLDVMAGVDYVIEQGIADSTRMVKSGWSAGGHMTNKIITFTNRFKAASSGAGAVDWISMYAQSDTRAQRTAWFGGTPWQPNAPLDVYLENSPLKYISRVTTPTIIFVGENDFRVPMPQSVELYRALKSNGVPTKLNVAPREPHGWRELRHRLFKMNAELEWFEKYARDKEYTWEKAPKN